MTDEISLLSAFEPVFYGLPELLFDKREGESQEVFEDRQREAIRDFCETYLWLSDKGKKVPIRLADPQVRMIADLFYGRVKKAIAWKARGAGGSLCAAIVIWLCLVYQKKSFTDMAGSGTQAQVVYDYTKSYWECVPETKKMLDGEPLLSVTKLSDGTYLKCVTSSEAQARGKHPYGLIADESCQRDPRKDDVLRAAMNSVFSHTDYMLLFVSTFHHPRGLFQEIWDESQERGFTRYKWNVYDVMETCTAEVNCKDCELTRRAPVYNDDGERVSYRWEGCNGRGRKSNGFYPREAILEAFRTNDLETFMIEFECVRPRSSGPIYDPDSVNDAFSHGLVEVKEPLGQIVGIDWGISTTAIIGPVKRVEDGLRVPRGGEKYFSGEGTDPMVGYLLDLRKRHGPFEIWADASNPFENIELQNNGFSVEPIAFNQWKEFGIKNLRKYYDRRMIWISMDLFELRRCLKAYHRDLAGKPVKKDDHGPDALMVAVLGFLFEDHFVKRKEQEGDDVSVRSY